MDTVEGWRMSAPNTTDLFVGVKAFQFRWLRFVHVRRALVIWCVRACVRACVHVCVCWLCEFHLHSLSLPIFLLPPHRLCVREAV